MIWPCAPFSFPRRKLNDESGDFTRHQAFGARFDRAGELDQEMDRILLGFRVAHWAGRPLLSSDADRIGQDEACRERGQCKGTESHGVFFTNGALRSSLGRLVVRQFGRH